MSDEDLDAPTQVQGFVHVEPEAALEFPGYEMIRELGRGGMGCVFLAKQESLDRLVALKTIQTEDPQLAEMLLQEAKIVGRMEHPAIVPVIEVNVARKPWFFSMAYVGGEDLARKISRGVMQPEDVADLGIRICEAVEYAHAKGVLHLDIKPANILLDQDGQAKLTDFGLAAIHSSKREGVFGTPQYMSPEQVLGQKELTPATDIYSLGAVLYAALAGTPPIVAASRDDLALRIVSRRPRNFRDMGLRVPEELSAIILQCLEKTPEKRYDTAKELRADLLAFKAGEPVKARPPSLFSRVLFFLRHHIFAASVSGSVVLLLLLLVAWVATKFYTQSIELQQIQEQYDTLRSRLTLLDRAQRLKVESAVAQDHFDEGKIQLAGKPAALAVLAYADGGDDPPEMLVKILREFAELHSFPDEAQSGIELARSVLEHLKSEDHAGEVNETEQAGQQTDLKSGQSVDPEPALEDTERLL